MQNIRTNELEFADSIKELFEKIVEEDRGPAFVTDEIIRIKGYFYKLIEIEANKLIFVPHGPRKDMSEQLEKEYKTRRPSQK